MRNRLVVLVFALTLALALAVPVMAESPHWAYGFDGPATANAPAAVPAPAAAPDTSMKSLAGSTLQFTLPQIRNAFGPADWYPGDHPSMPEIVAKGKMPDVRACSLCHYPNGKGRPENAGVTGLPTSYFFQTMKDFQDGSRTSADTRKPNTKVMITIAKGMTDAEIKTAAEYFGSMKWSPWIEVIETKMVPKTHIAGGMFLSEGGDRKSVV